MFSVVIRMPPHGPGMIGAGHSHDSKYPDDSWNLYAFLDLETTTALNVTIASDTVGIFKPYAVRLEEEPRIISDADAEIIVLCRFTNPVSVRKLMIIGGTENEGAHPSLVKCYTGTSTEHIDFNSIEDIRPAQEFSLPVNSSGTVELITSLQPFTQITSLVLYFPANHGESETTIIKYIGMQGEHTHYRREAVNTVYEVLCNGQDICQPEGVAGAEAPHFH